MQLGRDFVRALKQLTAERGLTSEVIASSLEAALISAYKKYQGGDRNVEVHIDLESGNVSIYEVRLVVDEVDNPDAQISLIDVQKLGFTDVEVNEYVRIEKNPENFGRIAAQTARQVIIQKLKDAERQIIFEEFSGRVGDLVNGIIFKSENDQVLVRLNDRTEAILPGESIIVDVIREGKEPHQGVGYLDDGTMLVVEDGEEYVGKRVEVVVTSMLQTSAGRMVFGRIRREVRV